MRVGVIGPSGHDTFADNILDSLPALGVEAVALGPVTPLSRHKLIRLATQLASRQTAETEAWFQRPLLARAREAHCDVIINVQQSLMPSRVAQLRQGGAKVALWYPDHLSNISRMAMIASDYDALFLKDPLFAERLTQIYGVSAFYLPEACNPSWHRPVGTSGQERFIVVVGNLYPTRARLLARLQAAGIPLKLYGSNFPRWYDSGPLAELFTGQFVVGDAKSRVFREARGVLNNLHPAEMNSVNARLFEATAAGGAVLCEHRPSLPDSFAVGREVLSFATFDELVDQCHVLLADDGATTRAIGDAATRRAHADHTYLQRLRSMLELLA